MTTISFFKVVLVILIMGTVSACSSTKPYTSNSPVNLSIKTDIRKGTAWMNVYEVDNACAMKYMGTVELEGSRVKVAIPINKPGYLLFTFADASLFTGNSRSSYGIYLTTRAGYQYDATVSYVDDMYTLMVHEQNPRGGERREISRNVPTACAAK
jgi:hypothetical protein